MKRLHSFMIGVFLVGNVILLTSWMYPKTFSSTFFPQDLVEDKKPEETLSVNTLKAGAVAVVDSQDVLVLLRLFEATGGPNWTIPWNLEDSVETWEGVFINENGRVDSLILPNNNLTGILPEEITNLSELRVLDFSGNSLVALPSLEKLVNLQELYLSQMGLRKIQGLSSLVNLTTLHLHTNELQELPELSGLTQLTSFRAFSNGLRSLHGVPANAPYTDFLVSNNNLSFTALSPYIDLWEASDENYVLFPQDSVGRKQTFGIPLGRTITLTIEDSSADQYQWIKDEITIATTTSSTLTLNIEDPTDYGSYYAQITDGSFPGETLTSFPKTVRQPDRRADSTALVALYELTDGPNWTNIWNLELPMDTWFGIQLDPITNRVSEINLTIEFQGNGLSGPLPQEIVSLTELRVLGLYGNNITEVPLLNGLDNLINLNLSLNNAITELPSLDSLVNLEALSFFYNPSEAEEGPGLSSLPDLSNLVNLRTLYISEHNLGGEIPGLENLENLTGLRALNTGLTSFPPIRNLENITILIIGNDTIPIDELDAISEMTNLENLVLVGIPELTELPSLENITNLRFLNVSRNPNLQSLPDLTGFPNPESLDISGDTILTNLDQISELESLRALTATDCELDDFPSLSNLVQLERLFVDDNNLDTLIGLDQLVNLEIFFCSRNNLRALPDLEIFSGSMTAFEAVDNQIGSFEGLETLSNLTRLRIDGNSIDSLTSLPSLENLTNLSILSLSAMELTEVRGLENLTQLEQLNLRDNSLSQLPDLTGLTRLQLFRVDRNNLQSLHGLPVDAPFTDVRVFSNNLDFDDLEPYQAVLNDTTINSTYSPQDSIGARQFLAAYIDSIDLEITLDEGSSNNTYQWFKNRDTDTLVSETARTLVLTPRDSSVAGNYFAKITNSSLPELTLTTRFSAVTAYDTSTVPEFDLRRRGPTLLVSYPDILQSRDKKSTREALEKLGLTLLDTCLCGEIEYYEVPEVLLDTLPENVRRIISDRERTPKEVEEKLKNVLKETLGETTSRPGIRDTLFEANWNYPLNLGELPESNDQWRARFENEEEATHPVTVAVIDFGVDSGHQEIHPFVWMDPDPDSGEVCIENDPYGYNFFTDTPNPFMDTPPNGLGHGTHIAGTLLGLLPNPELEVMSVQIGDSSGITGLFELACGLRYAIEERVDIINISLGYRGVVSGAIEGLFKKADSLGIIVVVSAGNGGRSNDETKEGEGHFPSNSSSPNVVSVGAVNSFVENQRANFSNFGDSTVDIYAPGVQIWGPLPGQRFGLKNGTSISAAFVTAALAYIKSLHPDWTIQEIIQELYSPTYSDSVPGLGRRLKVDLLNCNDEPLARDDSYTLLANSNVSLDILRNDCYGDSVTIQLDSDQVELFTVENDSIKFTVPVTEDTLRFTYTLTGLETTSSAEVSILVTIDSTSLSGRFRTPTGVPIPEVKTTAEETNRGIVYPSSLGDSYHFQVVTGSSIVILPEKGIDQDDNRDLDVDVSDISRLIEELDQSVPFDNPYQHIAGDVNGDGLLDSTDEIEIRKFIVHSIPAFSSPDDPDGCDRLWSFVPNTFVPNEPYFPITFPNFRYYPRVDQDTIQDFIGVKIGDVNQNWQGPSSNRRSAAPVLLLNALDCHTNEEGEIICPITALNFQDVIGFQFTAQWDSSLFYLKEVRNGALDIYTNENLVEKGILPVLWYQRENKGISLADSSILFTLVFATDSTNDLFPDLQISSSVTPARAYNSSFEEHTVELNIGTVNTVDLVEELFQLNAFPNPSHKQVTIRFQLPEQAQVSLRIIDIRGRSIMEWNGFYPQGSHDIIWDGMTKSSIKVNPGLYIVEIQANEWISSTKIIRK